MDFCPYFLHLYPSLGVLPPQLLTFVVYFSGARLVAAPNLNNFQPKPMPSSAFFY